MRVKAVTGASATLWGAAMLVVGLINLKFASYGTDFLKMMSSIDPGFHASRSLGEVLVGTLYGIVDGAILGSIFGSLYLWMVGTRAASKAPASRDAAGGPMPLRHAS